MRSLQAGHCSITIPRLLLQVAPYWILCKHFVCMRLSCAACAAVSPPSTATPCLLPLHHAGPLQAQGVSAPPCAWFRLACIAALQVSVYFCLQAGAYRTILTHFSQRYPKIPKIDDSFSSSTCIAFDLMSVNLAGGPLHASEAARA